MTEAEIKEKAARLLEETDASFPVPVEKIAAYLGVECHLYIPDKDVADIAAVFSHAKKKIYVNQNNSILQQRLAIARKIGYIVLYGADADYISYLHATSDQREHFIENFVKNLLMPEMAFRQQWRMMNKNISKLAGFFGASQFLISSRARSLNLL